MSSPHIHRSKDNVSSSSHTVINVETKVYNIIHYIISTIFSRSISKLLSGITTTIIPIISPYYISIYRTLRSSFFITLTIAVAIIASIIGYVLTLSSHSIPSLTSTSSLFAISSSSAAAASRNLSPIEEVCTLYCEGPLLHAVQMNYIYNDSKTFVDMPALLDPHIILRKFSTKFAPYLTPDLSTLVTLPPRDEIINFIHEHFFPAGSDLLPWSPTDWLSLPPIINSLQNFTIRHYSQELHYLWLQLGRQLITDIKINPQRHSLLYIPYPLIVPGGRFIEPYFWDTYFIILGLLRSNMVSTAEGMVLNLVHLTAQLGFVPNGGRAYYAIPGRSQPPLLSRMVAEVFGATGNLTFLQHCYGALRREYAWWMQTEGEYGHAVYIQDSKHSSSKFMNHTAKVYLLNRYVTDQHIPRPESYSEDIHTAHMAGYQPTDPSAQILFSEIAASAESGWDFTSRYFANYKDISTCDTSHIIPIDLNTIMYTFEQDLANFARILAQTQEQLCYNRTDQTTINIKSSSISKITNPPLSTTIIYCRRNPNRPVCRLPTVTNSVYDLSEQVSRLALEQSKSSSISSSLFHDAWETEEYNVDKSSSSSSITRLQCVTGLQEALWNEAIRYADAAEDRAKGIEALMWDEHTSQWYDLYIPSALNHTEPTGIPHAIPGRASNFVYQKNITQKTLEQRYAHRSDLVMNKTVFRTDRLTAANFIPLWAGLGNTRTNHSRVENITKTLQTSNLISTAGIFTTLEQTIEQWDWPNAWAPIQHMIITGLNATGEPTAQALSISLAKHWLKSGIEGFFAHGYSHEKYDARNYGIAGAGGEYSPQVGFGWTNGVALDLAVRYNFTSLEEEIIENNNH